MTKVYELIKNEIQTLEEQHHEAKIKLHSYEDLVKYQQTRIAKLELAIQELKDFSTKNF